MEELFGPFIEPVARVPKWLKESTTGLEKHVLDIGKQGLMPRQQTQNLARPPCGQEGDGIRQPEVKKIMEKKAQEARAPACDLQALVRTPTRSSSVVQELMGREVSECQIQTHSGVSLELHNCRETLRWLKGEIDVGLQILELALKRVENSGLLQAKRGSNLAYSIRQGSQGKEWDVGRGSRSLKGHELDQSAGKGPRNARGPTLDISIKKGCIQKGKEWAAGKGPRPPRGFKAKRNLFIS